MIIIHPREYRLYRANGQEQQQLSQYEGPRYEYDSFVIPEEMMASEPITALLEVTNTGSVVGGETLHLYVDGEPVETTFARIPNRTEEQLDFPLQFQTPRYVRGCRGTIPG